MSTFRNKYIPIRCIQNNFTKRYTIKNEKRTQKVTDPFLSHSLYYCCCLILFSSFSFHAYIDCRSICSNVRPTDTNSKKKTPVNMFCILFWSCEFHSLSYEESSSIIIFNSPVFLMYYHKKNRNNVIYLIAGKDISVSQKVNQMKYSAHENRIYSTVEQFK